MVKVGVCGWPVAHSLSPLLHRFWLKKYGIEGDYFPLAIEPAAIFPEKIREFMQAGFIGLNVTAPYKEQAFALCEEADEVAKACGSVNLLHFVQGKIRGFSVDGAGFINNLRVCCGPSFSLKGRKVLILGAGGAARALIFALLQAGADMVLSNRTFSRAEKLAAEFPGLKIVPDEARFKSAETASVIINTTAPPAKTESRGKEPLLYFDRLSREAIICDIVYRPLQTEFLQAAAAQGLFCVDGLGMLLHQAVFAFEEWFGIKPEVTEDLRKFMLEGLNNPAG